MGASTGQLNQVLMHLLVNAIDAVERADDEAPGARRRITLRRQRRDDQIVIQVCDTGVGIAEQDLPNVFDPGFTTRGPGVGTGFGLSTCYRIMHKHQGSIEISSALGQGTTATLRLPVR